MKLQEIIDRIEHCNLIGNNEEAFEQVIEALKLLAQGQQQVMGDVSNLQSEYRGQPIK